MRAKTPEKGTPKRSWVGGLEATCKKPNGSKPKGTHNKRVEAQVTLSVRRRRAEALQGRGRSGAPQINSKRYDAKK